MTTAIASHSRRGQGVVLSRILFFANMLVLLAVCAIPNAYKLYIVEGIAIIDIVAWVGFFILRVPRWMVASAALLFFVLALVVTAGIFENRSLYYTLRQSAFLLYMFQGLALLTFAQGVSVRDRWIAGLAVYLASFANVAILVFIREFIDPSAYPSLSGLLWLMVFSPVVWGARGFVGKALAIVGMPLAIYGSAHLSYSIAVMVIVSATVLHVLVVRRAKFLILIAALAAVLVAFGGGYYLWDVARHTDANISLRSILYIETLRSMSPRELLFGRGVGVPYFADLIAQYVVRQIGTAQERYEAASMTLTLHSSFLTILFHVGVLGLGLYLFVMGKMLSLGRLFQVHANPFAVAVCAGSLGGIVHASFNQFFEAPYHAFPFFCLVALGAPLGVQAAARKSGNPKPKWRAPTVGPVFAGAPSRR